MKPLLDVMSIRGASCFTDPARQFLYPGQMLLVRTAEIFAVHGGIPVGRKRIRRSSQSLG